MWWYAGPQTKRMCSHTRGESTGEMPCGQDILTDKRFLFWAWVGGGGGTGG